MNYFRFPVIIVAAFFSFSTLTAFASGSMPPKKTETTAAEIKINSQLATFIELGSMKCMPCKMMQPVMEDIEKEYSDRLNIVFYDVWTDEGAPYAKKYKIQAIPTQVFLDKEGKEFFRHTGFFPKEEIIKVLEKQGITKAKTSKKALSETPKAGK